MLKLLKMACYAREDPTFMTDDSHNYKATSTIESAKAIPKVSP